MADAEHRGAGTAREVRGGARRLAAYGSLAPGRPNHHELEALSGRWSEGSVRGHLRRAGWGATLGYPGLELDDDGDHVPVHVLESDDLPAHWARLDAFEGEGYRRVLATVHTSSGPLEAFVYALAPH